MIETKTQHRRVPLRKLKVRAMGISNWLYDTKTKERLSVQFYDYDYDKTRSIKGVINRILEIFPYDCIMYETKHGVQFISFSLLKGLRLTKSRSLELSKEFNQDYWAEAKDLALRFTGKWKVNRFTGEYKTISKKPTFKGVARFPSNFRISRQLLEFYKRYMNLPQWVYDLYDNCTKFNYRIKTYHYKTRD